MKCDLAFWQTESSLKRQNFPILSKFSNFKILQLYDMMVNRRTKLLAHELIGSMIFADGIKRNHSVVKNVNLLLTLLMHNCSYYLIFM